ncbi:unnamed protein product [Cylicocyclus nassatus]|uniref:Cytochrome c oxidase assembly protein COX11, mitochondrial n=1 Tax=Cylicocyclus nassatus TaxID=53992 RepID=A0AA36MAF8_CYLNA|nr:unnamed protein product [Cylicocyclus nassatus]
MQKDSIKKGVIAKRADVSKITANVLRAKVPCTSRCKCQGCQNTEGDRANRHDRMSTTSSALMNLAHSSSSVTTESPSPLSDNDSDTESSLRNDPRSYPWFYMTDEVIEAATLCLVAQAEESLSGCSTDAPDNVVEEMEQSKRLENATNGGAMERAFELAEEALNDNEVPVGCVFMYQGKEIGSGRNEINKTKDPTAHAEMVALRRMQEEHPNIREILHELVLYVTLEPCIMCACGLYELGISKIVYAAANERFGGIKSVGNHRKYNMETTSVEAVMDTTHEKPAMTLSRLFRFALMRLPQTTSKTEHLLKSPRPIVVASRAAHNPISGRNRNRDVMYYVVSLGVVAIGVTFAAIPAYRIFCEKTSFGGLTQVAKDFEKIAKMKKVEDRLIRVQFNSDVPSSMRWEFKPQQHEMYVHPGETALAFYTARNPTDRPIVGISSYNLTPFQAAYYFNKIQCFCFEEQILNPGEQVDLPVFFYIDPDYANDPALEYLDNILLSYTFFEAKSDLQLPSPFDPSNRPSVPLEKPSQSASS